MANKIRYDVDGIADASAKLSECTTILNELKKRLDSSNGTLSTSWKGEASTAFAQEYMQPLEKKLEIYSDMVNEFSSLLLKIKKQYEELTAKAEALKID